MEQVKIIIADTERFIYRAEKMQSQLAPYYVEKYHQSKIPDDAKQELVAGMLLYKYLGISRDDQIGRNPYGKPFLKDEDCYYNLSHSGKVVVLVVGSCEVGIDVEQVRSFHEATANKVFHSNHTEELHGMHGSARDECFTRIWTQYEAMLKLLGTGFTDRWDNEQMPQARCSIYTKRYGDYYITCATEHEATQKWINMEKKR